MSCRVRCSFTFLYGSVEKRVPAKHPLRRILPMVDSAPKEMSPWFSKLYSKTGRPSIQPERLLRASLLQIFYSIRSECQLMEQLDYNLLFRWFVGLDLNDPVWDHPVFSKNRDRLLNEKLADGFFDRVQKQANGLMSDEHFSVDGTLVEASASHKSFRRNQASEGAEAPAQNADNASERTASKGSTDTDPQEGAESTSEQAESATEQTASMRTASKAKRPPRSRPSRHASATSPARIAATKRTSPPPIRKRGCTAKARVPKRISATWGMR